jgi:hypothetical protein
VLCHYRWHGENTVSRNVERLQHDELSLLLREAGYCFANGLSELWVTRTRERLAAYRANWQHASSARAEEVEQAYAKLKTLTSEWDAALRELEKMRSSLQQAQFERDKALRDRDAVLCSTAWRTTWPLRVVGNRLPTGLRRLLGGGVKP